MLKSVWSRILGYVSFDAEPLSLSPQGDQLVCWAAPTLPTGRKVRATLPSGLVVYGETLWQRAVQDDQGRKLSCIRLGAQPQVSPGVAHPKGMRANRRVPARQWVSFPRLKGASGLSEDLSVDGCRVRLDLSHHLSEIHTMILDLPGTSDSVTVMAKILWSRGGQSGLRFLNMHIEDEARLARCLGLSSHPAKERWEDVWRRSMVSLTYRVTRLEDQDLVSLDFETSNWLATFQIRPAGIEGEWTGCFCRVDTLDSSLQLAQARQAMRIALDESRSLVHLRLLDEQNSVKLEIWGQEHAFSRVPRERQNLAR